MEGQERVPSLFVIPLIQFFIGALLFVALLCGQRDLTILCLLVLVLVNGARLWTWRSLSRITCRLRADKQKVFPGETLTVKVSAENAKFLPVWLQVRVPLDGFMRSLPNMRTLVKESGLLWYQRVHFEWELTAERRGVYHIGPLHIRAGDLFSFFSKHRRIEEFHQILVYPRVVPLKPISLPRRDFFGIPGARSPIQDPIYTLGTRDYQHGQPSKYIHWKASAHRDRLQEKIFESTHQEKILLVVNVDRFARHEAEQDFERTLEIVASLAVQLDQRGHTVGLVANGILKGGGPAIVPAARNHQQLPAILEVLARLQMSPNRELKDLLRHRLALAWGISCVYFSLEEDETVLAAREYFTWRKTPAVFFVCRPCFSPGEEGFKVRRMVYQLNDICAHAVENT